MQLTDHFQLAFIALKKHPLRTFLTMLGIMIGVSAIIAMVSIGLGARKQIDREISKLGTNLLIVIPVSVPSDGLNGAEVRSRSLTETDALSLKEEVSGLNYSVPVVTRRARVILGNKNWDTAIAGSSPEYMPARDWTIAHGRNFSSSEVTASAKVAVIGQTVADKISPENTPVGEIVRLQNIPFTIIGVLAKKGYSAAGRDQDDLIILPITTAKTRLMADYFFDNRGAVQYILLKAKSLIQVDIIRRDVERILRHRHNIADARQSDFVIQDPTEALATQQKASRTLTILLASIAAVSLIVGGISVMNIMLVSITERSQEIGIRMAVGAQSKDILFQFLTEAAVVTLVGGVIGSFLGVTSAYIIQTTTGWVVEISLVAIFFSLAFSTFVGLIAGVYPAFRASRLKPIEILRRE